MRPTICTFQRRAHGGFSLPEMLVVMAVASILIGLAGNGLRTTWRSQQIYTSATNLVQALGMARSSAIRYNRPTQVRIYRFQDGDLASTESHFRAYQLVTVNAGASQDQYNQLTEMQRFEGTTVMSRFTKYSSIVTGYSMLPDSTSYGYAVIEFRPDGSTNLETNPAEPWTITLLSDAQAGDDTSLPKDARTLVISPDTGAVSLF